MTELLLTTIVALSTWLTPMPAYAKGWLVRYGPEYLSQANADYRGYSMEGFACGGALMSPNDLGKVFWVRGNEQSLWFGPCLSVDASAKLDFYANVYYRTEIAELDDRAMRYLGTEFGLRGQVWVGDCPTLELDGETPEAYNPPLVIDPYGIIHPRFYDYPEQGQPPLCPTEAPIYREVP